MIIGEGNDFIEILATERIPGHLPRPGDARLAVSVSSGGFNGEGSCWVEAPRLAAFVGQLQELEASRQGAVEIESISPGRFKLRIWSVDRRGHIAVAGRITHQAYSGKGGPYPHALEFGFEFDPTLLPQMISGFQAIAEGPA